MSKIKGKMVKKDFLFSFQVRPLVNYEFYYVEIESHNNNSTKKKVTPYIIRYNESPSWPELFQLGNELRIDTLSTSHRFFLPFVKALDDKSISSSYADMVRMIEDDHIKFANVSSLSKVSHLSSTKEAFELAELDVAA